MKTNIIIKITFQSIFITCLMSQNIVTYISRDENDDIVSIEYFKKSLNRISLIKSEYYYPNGQLEILETYEDGKHNGIFREYFDNGKIKTEVNYKNGKKYGACSTFYLNGNKESIYNLNNSEIINGSITKWYDNGEMKSKGNYSKGEKHGIWTFWYNTGLKKGMTTFINGTEEGIFIKYYHNGNKQSEGVIDQNGQKEERCWDESGGIINCHN